MKINEETTVSEEQVLFNKLNWENQQMILRIMRCLQPCELNCEVEKQKKIPEKLNLDIDELRGKETSRAIDYLIESKLNEVLDYLKSKENKYE